jgi:valyl-tRNA synthetase
MSPWTSELGAVKITPAHDPNDFEVGKRHGLAVINVMTEDGKMNENAGKYEGMGIYECRKAIVKELEELGLLVRIEPCKHNVGTCYRCGTTVEPRVSLQWFVHMEPLAVPAIKAVRKGDVRFIPDRFDKTYYHWMENIKDWCISRQLWWGHRIPAFYCSDCGEMTVSRTDIDTCPKCGSKNIKRDPDTLDTWFSSALWPFSTLGWPDDTPEFRHYFPTSTLVTGYDIIFFWVARMIFSSLEQTGEVPFDTVFIHGLVRDAQGRKMSKSLGNGIDPLEIIDKYGADALRFTLATGNSPGNDMRFSDEKVEASRNFANKIWNASRFILMNLDGTESAPHVPSGLTTADKWILSKFNTLAKEVNENIEKFELGTAVAKLYDFIWDSFCDWYIEIAKIELHEDTERASVTKDVLIYVMSETLKLLHPFMPFITEEIWQTLPHDGETIMLASYPVYDPSLAFDCEEAEFERVMKAVRAIRNRRAEMNVPASRKAHIYIDTAYQKTFEDACAYIMRLAYCSEISYVSSFSSEGCAAVVTEDARIYIPMGDLVDITAEKARLEKELAKTEDDLRFIDNKLSNENFVSKAPAAVVEGQRSAREKLSEKKAMLSSELAKLG